MAVGVVLYNSRAWLPLTTTANFGVDPSASFGHADVRRVTSTPWQWGYDPLGSVSWGNRTMTIPVHFAGADMADWSTAYQGVRDVLAQAERWQVTRGQQGDAAYLAVQLSGQVTPLVFDVLGGDIDVDAARHRYAGPTLAAGTPRLLATPVKLICKPFAHPQGLTRLTTGTLANAGAPYIQPGVLGNWECPARVTVTPSTTYQWMILARRTLGNISAYPYPLTCATGSYTNYTVAASITPTGATGWKVGNQVAAGSLTGSILRAEPDTPGVFSGTNATLTITWTFNAHVTDILGTMRMLLRIFSSAGGTISSAALTYGGASGTTYPTAGAVTTNLTTNGVPELGLMPVSVQSGYPTSFVFAVTVALSGSGGTSYKFDFDCLFNLPMGEGMVDYQLSAASSAGDQFVVGQLGFGPVAANVSSLGAATNVVARPYWNSGLTQWAPGRAAAWYALFGSGNIAGRSLSSLSDTYTLRLEHQPMYELVA